jgi:hypothetical protein
VLIATSTSETWLVDSYSCNWEPNATAFQTCDNTRGGLFNITASRSWLELGSFTLGFEAEQTLGYGDTGHYGLDTVGIGTNDGDGPALPGQVVATTNSTSLYLGSLGLGPYSTNLSDFQHEYKSLLTSLKDNGSIPSLSWGYTAGAYNHPNKPLGNLVLGGFDKSLFKQNNLTFEFSPDTSLELQVGLQAITTTFSNGTEKTLLSTGITALLDSTIPHIWLPESVCTVFEQVFGLVWDSASELYLISESLHNDLTALNPNITFTLGNTQSGGNTVQVTLQYSSFDLVLPLKGTGSFYFPLRRTNSSQYILGRTFFQQA